MEAKAEAKAIIKEIDETTADCNIGEAFTDPDTGEVYGPEECSACEWNARIKRCLEALIGN